MFTFLHLKTIQIFAYITICVSMFSIYVFLYICILPSIHISHIRKPKSYIPYIYKYV